MTSISKAAHDVLAERERQITVEGWSPSHDNSHRDGSLAAAAACYLVADKLPSESRSFGNRDSGMVPKLWPITWAYTWFKPKTRRADLVRAAALTIAEIERLDRAEAGL